MRRNLLYATGAVIAVGAASLGLPWLSRRKSALQRHAIVQAVFAKALPPLTHQHLQLIRQLRVTWLPIESGAPGIDPAQPLLGDSLGLEATQQILQTRDADLATKLLAEVCLWVPEFTASATLAPGSYALPAGFDGKTQNEKFEFRAEHLTLLQAALWREVDDSNVADVLADEDSSQPLWPMPYIDGKRPYGDRSYYQIDMAELLGQPYAKDAQGRYILPPEKDEALKQLHLQTQAALQVLFMYCTPAKLIESQ
ncbi:hypothetical protein DZC30_11765 [Comamonas testosteroni]|uniref:Uncharacterized protein n=1 Tax=Comamonas testosteroni TaxID=285 RepID=A0A373FNV2_COMTE|nr:hypothetical protein DZC30_11765 [Comamonas testosteroni]